MLQNDEAVSHDFEEKLDRLFLCGDCAPNLTHERQVLLFLSIKSHKALLCQGFVKVFIMTINEIPVKVISL